MINFFIPFKMIAVLACALLALFGFNYSAQADEKSVFTKATIDLGIVVSDLDKAAKFYSEVIGLTEVDGFRVPGERTAEFGLTDKQPITSVALY